MRVFIDEEEKSPVDALCLRWLDKAEIPLVELVRDGYQHLAFSLVLFVLAALSTPFFQSIGTLALGLAGALALLGVVALAGFVRARKNPFTQWVLRLDGEGIALAPREHIPWTSVDDLVFYRARRGTGASRISLRNQQANAAGGFGVELTLAGGGTVRASLDDLGLGAKDQGELETFVLAAWQAAQLG